MLGAFLCSEQALAQRTFDDRNKVRYESILVGQSALLHQSNSIADSKQRTELFNQVSNVLDELGNYRTQFLTTENMIDIFPTVYYYVTSIEMKLILEGNYCYPIEKMQQILIFYNAYKINRISWDSGNIKAVEPHWIKHFAEVDKSKLFGCNAIAALASGIDAHVKCDLPRALRSSFINTSFAPELLFDEFKLSDNIFEVALTNTLFDIQSVNWCGAVMKILNNRFSERGVRQLGNCCCKPFDPKTKIYLSGDVIRFRALAWQLAISDSVLKNLDGIELQAIQASNP